MILRRLGLLAVGAAVLTGSLAAPAARAADPCVVASGQRIVLMSSELDPDVFVWDARQRVSDYASGYWKTAKDVMEHTLIMKPGTRAVVVACIRAGAQAKYTKLPLDVIGLKIVSGPDRGRYGWVTAEDVHSLRAGAVTADAKPTRAQR